MKKINLKIFWLSFIPVFMIVFLQHVGIRAPKINTPSVLKINSEKNIWDIIKPKLEENKNTFKLFKKTSFISYSFAASLENYDNANAYLILDCDSGEILGEKDKDKKLSIASLTKIMTAVVALDLANVSDLFEISQKAANVQPTKIGVIPFEKMSLYELLNALLLTSANDAAQVIKEGIDKKYNEKVFIKAMNEKARMLNLQNTSFDNPMGFDGLNNYSSAADLATLTHYAIEKYPVIAEIVKKDYVYLSQNLNHKEFDLYNWNGLIGVYPNVSGVKIGNTDNALFTSIVISQRSQKKLMAVLLGAPSFLERDLWISNLLDYGFEKTLGLERINVTTEQFYEKYSTWKYYD